MNHALICKNYYGEEVETVLAPEVKKLEMYFNALRTKDWYYNAMKYHAIHLLKELVPGITLHEIGRIMNIDHSTVIHYLKRYIPMDGHRMFISQYFEKFVENQIYPLKPKNKVDIKKYGKFKPTTLAEARMYHKEPASIEERKKTKRKVVSKKNPQERY